MASINDFPARGKVIAAAPDRVTFMPTGTNYEMHLATGGVAYAGPLNVPVSAIIRVEARKLWTVPSGGGFVSPIFGPPKSIQGRVRHVGASEMVVTAGTNFVVSLPGKEHAFDLSSGDVGVGALVNIVALPGARFEWVQTPGATTTAQPVVATPAATDSTVTITKIVTPAGTTTVSAE
ncbi:MAG TPA: hypothetical protein VGN72_09305 [Tepidisphaeraceae bacterium]|nr:hypothetical protein [Tepidisphaeraceae bacterium]